MEKRKTASLTQLFKYLARITRPFYLQLGLVFCFVVFEALTLNAFFPQAIEHIVDLMHSTSVASLPKKLRKPMLVVFFLWCFLEMNVRLQDYFFCAKIVPGLSRNIYKKKINKLLAQSYAFYQTYPPGVIANHLHLLADTIPDLVDSLLRKITFFFLAFFVANVILFRVSTFAGLGLVIYLLFMVSIIFFFNKKISFWSIKWTRKRSRVVTRTVDIVSNFLTVKLFSSKKKEQQQLDKLLDDTWKAEKKVEYTYVHMFFWLGFGYLLLQGITIYFLLFKAVPAGAVSIGQFTKVLYMNETVAALLWDDLPDLLDLSKQVGKVKEALVLDHIPVAVQDKPGAKEMVVTKGRIVFKDVTFAFNDQEVPLFNKLNLTIPPGQKVGIVGYTGSGKSTLVKLLLRLYDVQGGAICIDGQNIANVTLGSLHNQLGLMPQEVGLLQRTLRENLTYGQGYISDQQITQVAKSTDVHDVITSMPNGYDTELGKENMSLSGGEKQRFGLTRLLLKKPPIVLLDEATSQMDTLTEKKIQDVINNFCQGKTTLIIAHRLSTLLEVDRIIVLNKGAIVEDGTHEQLLTQKGLYARFWETQSEGFLVT